MERKLKKTLATPAMATAAVLVVLLVLASLRGPINLRPISSLVGLALGLFVSIFTMQISTTEFPKLLRRLRGNDASAIEDYLRKHRGRPDFEQGSNT
jgi:uncharacterized membrane protein YccC